VKYQPESFHAFVSVSWPGFLGTQTAFNDAGLTYSENTLKPIFYTLGAQFRRNMRISLEIRGFLSDRTENVVPTNSHYYEKCLAFHSVL
jgi:hypothetical protein